MATAYMKQNEKGEWITTVRNSEGDIVKVIPTDPSQIREERVSLLWKPERILEENDKNIYHKRKKLSLF